MIAGDPAILSMSEEFTRDGIEDVVRFNRWAHSIGAITPYAKTKPLPGINIPTETLKDMLSP